MRPTIAVAALLALTACAEVPSSRAYVLMSANLDEKTQLVRYQAQLDDADIALLDGKINVTETYYRGAPPCTHIKSDGYPTPAESAALRRWAALRAAYFEQFYALELRTGAASEKVAPLTQRYVDALREDLQHSTALISGLAAGEMTYCEFATRQKDATIASSDRAGPLHKEMIAAMAEEHYFDGTGLSGGISDGPASFGLGIGMGSSPGGHMHTK